MPKKKTHKEYCIELSKKNKHLKPIEEYDGYMTYIKHYCEICGETMSLLPRSILKNPTCPCCENKMLISGVNDLETVEPYLSKFLLNKDDGKKYKPWSSKKVDWICPNCNSIVHNKRISDVMRYRKIPCKICNDGVSMPMKMVTYVVSKFIEYYKTECVFDDWNFELNGVFIKPRYDIVFNDYIIEVDGGFHYFDNTYRNVKVEEQQYIDKQKDLLALAHGYKMIRIDAKLSEFDYIKANIIKSLGNVFDLSLVDWRKCFNYAISSSVKMACDYKNQHPNKTTTEISKDLNIPYSTLIRYLKKGADIGICIYDAKLETQKNAHAQKPSRQISVICLNTKEIFNSLSDAILWCGLSSSGSISDVCKGKRSYGGRHPETNEPLHWMYYEDYLKSTAS